MVLNGGMLMNKRYIELGTVPMSEDCFQAGFATEKQLRDEAIVYRKQLQRMFPEGDFCAEACPHDFGNYYEVVIYYEPSGKECDCGCAEDFEDCTCCSVSEKLAYYVEENLPVEWDAESKKLKEYIKWS